MPNPPTHVLVKKSVGKEGTMVDKIIMLLQAFALAVIALKLLKP